MTAENQILIIDDEDGMRQTLADVLEDWGYGIQTVGSGEEALNQLKKNTFNIVLADIGLPDMNGMKLLEQIKLINPESAVIMITGNASVETAVEAMRFGAYAYVTKPFEMNELKALLKKVSKEIRLSIENKKLIDQLQCSNRDLERYKQSLEKQSLQLKITNEELQATIGKLNQLNRQLEEFVYVASHDLKEPARQMFSYGKLLAESLEGRLDENDKENLGFIISGSERMQQMIKSLLEYSRVTTRGGEFEKVNLNDTIEELRQFELSHLLAETGGEIVVSHTLESVEADLCQMRQLLQNLISNGLKYHRKDVTPVITISSEKSDDGKVRVAIRDNGIGIEKKHFEEIFVMFRRLHTTNEYEGTGIGLAICKKIIERHSGQIGVESELGKGTTFWFTVSPVKEISREMEEHKRIEEEQVCNVSGG